MRLRILLLAASLSGASQALAQQTQDAAEAEARIQRRLQALDDAWAEVQAAHRALREAEERLAAGVEPQEGEPMQLEGQATPAPAAVGGPQPPAPPAVGGPQAPAAPAVGGPMSGRRQGGGGRQSAYRERMDALEAAVARARERRDRAYRAYSEAR